MEGSQPVGRGEGTHGLQPGGLRRGMRSTRESIGSDGKETNRAKSGHHLHRCAGGDGQNRIRRTGHRPTVRLAGEKMDSEAEREGPKRPNRISLVPRPQ